MKGLFIRTMWSSWFYSQHWSRLVLVFTSDTWFPRHTIKCSAFIYCVSALDKAECIMSM